jgi:phosphatidate cytidylyltransferase
MKELVVRAASGAVFAAIILGSALLGPFATMAVFGAITAIAAWEWHRLQHARRSNPPHPGLTVALALLSFLAMARAIRPAEHPFAEAGIAIAAMLVACAWMELRRGDAVNGFLGHLGTVGWLAVPLACAVLLVHRDPLLFIGFILLLWTNDTGAYLVGKALGRRKLMPAISPGKTWEGFIGGLLLTLGASRLLAGQWPQLLDPGTWSVLASLVSLAATIGDLFESAVKRAAGVKDSGKLMPGHGGALDRFDGYLFAAPLVQLVAVLAA